MQVTDRAMLDTLLWMGVDTHMERKLDPLHPALVMPLLVSPGVATREKLVIPHLWFLTLPQSGNQSALSKIYCCKKSTLEDHWLS